MGQLAEPGLETWPIGIHSQVQHKIVGHHNLSGTRLDSSLQGCQLMVLAL